MDPSLLLTALVAGAAVAGGELVKETTKDAYKGLKTAVTSVFGKRAERALEAVELSPADVTARFGLKETLPAIDPRDATELQAKTTALLTALKDDPAAIQAVDTVARIRLDIDSGGNVVLEDIRGARQIDVRSKSDGDFAMRSIDMDMGQQRGNE